MPAHPRPGMLLPFQVCLVDFAISKQRISAGGQERGEMKGKRLAGSVKQLQRSCSVLPSQ